LKIILFFFAYCLLILSAEAQVRTADADMRGLRASDFPRIIQLAENVYAYEDLMGEIGTSFAFTTNSLFVVTSDGVLVADGQGSVEKTQRMIDEIATITEQPIRYVVICADHIDHVAGNSAFPESTIFLAHPNSKAEIERLSSRALIPVPMETVSENHHIMLGDTEFQVQFLGRAHTGGDLIVYLPQTNILFTGEIFFNRLYPSVGGNRSGRPTEWIQTLKRVESMNANIVVPGHGFVDAPDVLAEELVNFRHALENLVSESTRLHDTGIPSERASRSINLGEYQYWYRAVNNLPDAIDQVYRELDGGLE
jgi:cyclase